MPAYYQPFILFIGFAILFVAVFGTAAYVENKRKKKLAAALEQRGFRVVMKPEDGEKLTIFAALSQIRALKHGHSGVRWFALGRLDGREAIICEHSYTTGSGKNRTTHVNTVVAVPAPQVWQPFTLTSESFLHRIGEMLGFKKDLQLENEQFNKRWRILCDSEEIALVVLTPEVQAMLMDARKLEWWCIGGGRIACGIGSSLREKDLADFLDRPPRLIAAMAPEVRAMLPQI